MSTGVRYLERGRARCHWCHEEVVVLKCGTIRKHFIGPRGQRTPCRGSHTIPREPLS